MLRCSNFIAFRAAAVLLLVLGASAQNAPSVQALLEKCIASYARVEDYVVSFHKKELLDEKIREDRNILFKFRKELQFYLRWTEGKDKGMEVVYVEGKHKGRLIARPGGILHFIKISLDPVGSRAMSKSRHPIYESGIGHIVGLLEKFYALARDDAFVQAALEGKTNLQGRKAWFVRVRFPEGRGYYAGDIRLYFDEETSLPLKATVFGWKGEFWEEYEYSDLQLNVGLTEDDFVL